MHADRGALRCSVCVGLLMIVLMAQGSVGEEKDRYQVLDHDGKICILMNASFINLTVTYTNKTEGSTTKTLIVVDSEKKVYAAVSNASRCDPHNPVLALMWESEEANTSNFFLSFTFTKTSNEKRWALQMIRFNFSKENFPDIKTPPAYNTLLYNKSVFGSIHFNRSVKCSESQPSFTDDDDNRDFTVMLHTEDVRAQAFDFTNRTTGEFDKYEICASDKPSLVVPIVVGVCLGVLVVAVVIVWLVGKFIDMKKSKAASYNPL